MEQLRGLMRIQNCFSLQNAEHMIMETGGNVSLTTYDSEDQTMTILLIDEGFVEENVLLNHNLDKLWLKNELKKIGYDSLDDIAYAEWSKEKGFYVVSYADTINHYVLLDG